MEPKALVFVFLAWDTDVCTSRLQTDVSLSDGHEPGSAERKTPGELG
jgi:hypothetical protein